MIRYTLTIILSLFSLTCNATSCVISEKTVIEQSKKYKALVKIEVTNNHGSLTIVLNAPSEIQGKRLGSVILHKDKGKNDISSFSIPLNFTVEDHKAVAWLGIDEKTAKHNFLLLDYGEECAISIKYRIAN